MLSWCHSMVMTKLQDGEKLSYTQMHRNLEEHFNVGVTVESLRYRLIRTLVMRGEQSVLLLLMDEIWL